MREGEEAKEEDDKAFAGIRMLTHRIAPSE
jgi:hypothetical protein